MIGLSKHLPKNYFIKFSDICSDLKHVLNRIYTGPAGQGSTKKRHKKITQLIEHVCILSIKIQCINAYNCIIRIIIIRVQCIHLLINYMKAWHVFSSWAIFNSMHHWDVSNGMHWACWVNVITILYVDVHVCVKIIDMVNGGSASF